MLKGVSTTKMDEKGRIIIPSKFRKIIEAKYGRDVYLISFDRKSILLYPVSIWEGLRFMLGERKERTLIQEIMIRKASSGKVVKIDNRGRILIPQTLREEAKLEKKLIIEGRRNHLRLSREL